MLFPPTAGAENTRIEPGKRGGWKKSGKKKIEIGPFLASLNPKNKETFLGGNFSRSSPLRFSMFGIFWYYLLRYGRLKVSEIDYFWKNVKNGGKIASS